MALTRRDGRPRATRTDGPSPSPLLRQSACRSALWSLSHERTYICLCVWIYRRRVIDAVDVSSYFRKSPVRADAVRGTPRRRPRGHLEAARCLDTIRQVADRRHYLEHHLGSVLRGRTSLPPSSVLITPSRTVSSVAARSLARP